MNAQPASCMLMSATLSNASVGAAVAHPLKLAKQALLKAQSAVLESCPLPLTPCPFLLKKLEAGFSGALEKA